MRRVHVLCAAAALALALAGCAENDIPPVESSSAPTASPSETATPSPTPTPTPTPQAFTYEMICTFSATPFATRTFTNYLDALAWQTTDPTQVSCRPNGAPGSTANLTEAETAASTTAIGSSSAGSALQNAYASCGDPDLGYLDAYPTSPQLPTGVIDEVAAALLLCPDHPRAGEAQAEVTSAQGLADALASGTAFGSGTYRVGADIQPGFYASESTTPYDGCYWERTDAAGNIIDNNFVTSAFRVEVTIAASDFSFLTEGCGTWRLQ